ncbi:tetratricopeptide repeat protein [Streptomyces sp. NPDC093510]|uniref:tetratricopeptide repeat protein n=1 Tax=Streptomyces sp. NPDC093510 TaxID=3155199 RepID=UPI00341A034D
MTIDRLRDTLDALGPPVTPLELAEMLWLAERLPSGAGAGAGEGSGGSGDRDAVNAEDAEDALIRAGLSGPGRVPRARGGQEAGPSASGGAKGDPSPTEDSPRAVLHVPRGASRPGSDADEVLVPAPQALHHELAIQRALRPLKRRVPDRRRRVLDEEATAARAARHPGLRPWVPVLTPVSDRFLSLALVADTGPAMAVWRPLVRELREALQRTGAFRDVRLWHLADLGSRVGVRSSPGGPAMPPGALVDPTGRQVTLVLSDCSGPHWWGGRAAPALYPWARRGPTAILQPLPERLWRRTAAPAVPGRAIASRAGAPNTALRFTPHDGRAAAVAADTLPVPVLELAPEWLADWAGLITASGDRRRDTAVTYVSAAPAPHLQPLTTEGDLPITERILRFQSVASPTAVDLAAHVALAVPALPVMRLIQQRVTPGSRPSDLAEVLLSGLLEPVGTDSGLYDFVPGARHALLGMLPRAESLEVAELLTRLGEEIEEKAGSASRAFRAVVRVTEGAGSRALGPAGQPFALVSEEALGLLRGRVAEQAGESAATADATAEGGASPVRALDLPVVVPRQEVFVGRTRELDHLNHVCEAARLGPAPRAVVLHGVEGVGKTALATEWATRMAVDHGPVWWMQADSPASIVRGLAELTRVLRPAVPEFFAGEGRWEWALQWLSAHEDWVLVLDDVRNPADVRVLLSRFSAGGHVLITSRTATGWEGIATPTELGVLELDEAVELFTRYWGRDAEGAAALCEDLGRLPLAVERAGKCVGSNWGVEDEGQGVVVESRWHEAAYLSRRVRQFLRSSGDTVTRQLLSSLAWLAPDPVPREVLTGGVDPSETARALEFLSGRGLVRLGADTVLLPASTASLVRLTVQGDPDRGEAARQRAVACIADALPEDPDDPATWPSWWRLVPHVEELAEHSSDRDDIHVVTTMLAAYVRFLVGQGQLRRAVDALERAFAARTRHPGSNEPQTLATAAMLAAALLEAGDLRRSIALYADTVGLLSMARGPDDPHVLELRADLAGAYLATGATSRAVKEMEAVRHRAARALGEEHPCTLTLRIKLAGAYLTAERWEEAIETYTDTLAACRRVWGDTARGTLALRGGLALAYEAVGREQEALAEWELVVTGFRTSLGAGHPVTVRAQSDLAARYWAAGMSVRAIELYEAALAGSSSALGDTHPETMTLREGLARVSLAEGNTDWAVPILERSLGHRYVVSGSDHPDTLAVVGSLAAAYSLQGASGEASALYERLGRAHAGAGRYLRAMEMFGEAARCLEEQGRVPDAVALLQDALTTLSPTPGMHSSELHPLRRQLERLRRP